MKISRAVCVRHDLFSFEFEELRASKAIISMSSFQFGKDVSSPAATRSQCSAFPPLTWWAN
jgi:hypothetical protein